MVSGTVFLTWEQLGIGLFLHLNCTKGELWRQLSQLSSQLGPALLTSLEAYKGGTFPDNGAQRGGEQWPKETLVLVTHCLRLGAELIL